ncbi:hypothetical protein NPJ82_16960 (plasmid) [Sphingomonas sp. NY01]|uniref:hypothetical protein n=1 Tax=Sphingomonas sp. NY01 TaxID=2968057 RepID=UPI00315CB9F7
MKAIEFSRTAVYAIDDRGENGSMDQHRRQPGQDPVINLERSLRRITGRYTWTRMFLFGALLVWLIKSYGTLVYDVVGQSYIGVWLLAAIGCWTASGWLLDLPRQLFPDVQAFQHLRRPAPPR